MGFRLVLVSCILIARKVRPKSSKKGTRNRIVRMIDLSACLIASKDSFEVNRASLYSQLHDCKWDETMAAFSVLIESTGCIN